MLIIPPCSSSPALIDFQLMRSKRLSWLLGTCGCSPGQHKNDPEVTSIAYDSRDVRPGAIFFAIEGIHTDGHQYINRAIEAGAVAVFHQKSLAETGDGQGKNPGHNAVFIHCENTKAALSEVSAAFFDTPADELIVIGVTGTDGKSSTVSFMHQLLECCGIPSGFISTVAMQTSSATQDNNLRQSTPEAPKIHSLLREMADSGKKVAIVESTSHGLSWQTSRLRNLYYDGAIFTNISHEHLEFHGSFEQYLDDKANLFRQLRPASSTASGGTQLIGSGFSKKPVACINEADPHSSLLSTIAGNSGGEVIHYFANHNGTSEQRLSGIMAEGIQLSPTGSKFVLRIGNFAREVNLPVPGSFNVDNVLGCIGLLHGLFGISTEQIVDALSNLRGVKGRMLVLDQGQKFTAVVDYAHTPGSFNKVFPMFRESCSGRLIAVFGSAGERDIEKRPVQGKIAAQFADVLVISDEDPRLENSMTIIDQIAAGALDAQSTCEIVKIADRKSAIKYALESAEEGDMVVMLGKGHEGSIIMADGKHPWDEEMVARGILSDMGYPQDQNLRNTQ